MNDFDIKPDDFFVGASVDEINTAITIQAKNHAKIAQAHELARDELRKAKSWLEFRQAGLSEQFITQLEATKQKWTIDRIKNLVLLEVNYQKALGDVTEAEKKVGMLGALRDASTHQKDMLVTISANYRHDDREGVYASPTVGTKTKIGEYQKMYGKQT